MRARSYFSWRAMALLPAAALAFAACDRSAGPQHDGSAITGPAFGVASPLGSPQDSTGGGPPSRYRYRGAADYADAWFGSGGDSLTGGYTSGSLSVYLSTDGSGAAYLYYTIMSCDATWYCTTLEDGSGPIPAADIRFSHNGAELNTNTSAEANPGFTRYVGSGGPFVVSWTANGLYRTRSTSSERTEYTDFRVQRRYTSEAFGATTAGTAVTLSFAGAWGTVGSATNYEFDVWR